MVVLTRATEDLDAVQSYKHFIVLDSLPLPSFVFATFLPGAASIATAHCSPESTPACLRTSQSNFSLSRLEVVMKKFFFRSLLMVALAVGASLTVSADTIRL